MEYTNFFAGGLRNNSWTPGQCTCTNLLGRTGVQARSAAEPALFAAWVNRHVQVERIQRSGRVLRGRRCFCITGVLDAQT